MSQLDHGLTVDEGYRTVVAGEGSRGGRGAGKPSTVPGESLGPMFGSEEWNLPGQGESGGRCGEWYPAAVCESCGEVDMATHSCGNRSCPECWARWAQEAAVRAAVRIQAFRYTQPDDYRRQVAHAVVSPPEGEVMNEQQYWEAKKRAAEIAKGKGFRGFAVIPHPYRVTDEGKERYREEDPEYGVWVWLRNEVEEMERYIYWSPHYHVIGPTTASMEEGRRGDEYRYVFVRSLGRFEGVRDSGSHEEVYGLFRYLLSHTGYPAGSSRQVTTWHGDLANNVFVEEAREEWQNEKPSEGVLSALEREVRAVAEAGAESEEGEGGEQESDEDREVCPREECEGVLIGVFEVDQYLRQADPPPEVRGRMEVARDWRLGREEPPPGMKRPGTEERAREAFRAMCGDSER